MNAEEKKRLANEKRLQAIKQWKKNRTVSNIVKNAAPEQNRKDVLQRPSKLTLFNSDDEDEKFDNCFDIRPQFEGPRGPQLLEMSSQFSNRFKLDERFKDDEVQLSTEENDEKMKNLKILESVIGYEVRKTAVDGKTLKRKQIRFDPEDESSSKYFKASENTSVKPKKKQKDKKSQSCNGSTDEIPTSSERYIEVNTNLKDILNSASGPFSLSQKFSCDDNSQNNLKVTDFKDFLFNEKERNRDNFPKSTISNSKNNAFQTERNALFEPKVKSEPFFICEGDPRLKEGVEFFKRPKPLDKLREEWQKRREVVLEIFRRMKKSTHRKPPKVQKVQSKYSTKYKAK